MKNIDISIIIVNYNTLQLTKGCVESVFKYNKHLSIEVIVVDNFSKEPGLESLKELFPEVILIESQENLGFAGGNNLGIARAKGRYILLLNSDAFLKDDALYIAWKYMESHPKAGVVSTRLVYPDGRHQSVAQRFPSIRYKLIELFRLQKLMSHKTAGKLLLGSFFEHDKNVIADWVWGAFFLFRRQILDRMPVNKLDDSYFMYWEDTQWCFDFRRYGYEVHFCSEAEVIHLMGGSSANKLELMKKNQHLFMKRNYNIIHRKCIEGLDLLLSK